MTTSESTPRLATLVASAPLVLEPATDPWSWRIIRHGVEVGEAAATPERGGAVGLHLVLAPEHRGHGLGTAAARLVADHVVDDGAPFVRALVPVGEWAARRVAWRLGLRHEGTLHHVDGAGGDVWSMGRAGTDPGEPPTPWWRPPVLRTEGVVLRPVGAADLPRVVEACRDARTRHWLGRMPDPYDLPQARAWWDGIREEEAAGTAVTRAIAAPDDDRLLGAINLFDLTVRDGEVGYWAHPEARGRGLMTRAARACLAWAFTDAPAGPGLARVAAAAAVGNTASRHVLSAAGLREWGVERLGTVLRTGPADAVRYDVLREEFTGST